MTQTNGNGSAVTLRDASVPADASRSDPSEIMYQVLAKGDLSALSNEEIARYEVEVCRSVGLNPLTKPFDVIALPGNKRQGSPDRKILYANRNAGDQLTGLHKITREVISRELVDGVYIVTARATMPDGRFDESIGAVPLLKEGGRWVQRSDGQGSVFEPDGTFTSLPPDQRANKMMHAETKAKRRAVLSLVGLSFLDESELDTIRSPYSGSFTVVDRETGEIVGSAPTPALGSGTAETRDRNTEKTALLRTVKRVFAADDEETAHIATDLVTVRFAGRTATADDLAEVRTAVERWRYHDVARSALDWLVRIGNARTESEAVDIGAGMEHSSITDDFLHAAVAARIARFEQQRTDAAPDMGEVDAVIDAAVGP